MSNYDIIAVMKKTISDMREEMSHMEEGIHEIARCIEDGEFIPEVVGQDVINRLTTIGEINNECKLQYRELFDSDISSSKIATVENDILEKEQEISREKMGDALLFLNAYSTDEKINAILKTEEENFTKLIEEDNLSEEQLKNYKFFVEVIRNKDSIDPSKGFQIADDIRKCFGDDVAAHAVFNKDIFLKDDCLNDEIPVSDDIENYDSIDEETISIEQIPQDEQNNEEEESDIAALAEENDETTEISELACLIRNNGFDASCINELGRVRVETNDKEEKKIGVKAFKNELRESKLEAAICIILGMIFNNGFVNEQTIPENCPDMPAMAMNSALKFLREKGYVRRYSIRELGHIYTASKRAMKMFNALEAKKFLKIDVKKSPLVEKVDLNDYEFLNLIASHKTDSLNETSIDECKLELEAQNTYFGESTFIRIIDGEYDNGEKECHLMVCIFDYNDEFCEIIEDTIEKIDCIRKVVFISTTLEQGQILVKSFEECEAITLPDDVYVYSLNDKQIHYPDDGSIVPGEEFFKDRRNFASDEEIIEENSEDISEEITEEKPEEKPEEAEKEETKTETVKPVISPKSNLVNEEKESDPEIIMENASRMISEGKTYCATAYLKAYGEESKEVEEIYEKLAYAVNDPLYNCSYSSDEMFNVFPDNEEGFTNYLFVSAAVRNFFYNHISYDYTMKSLYEGKIKDNKLVSDCSNLGNIMYKLTQFKDSEHKGMDACADYRLKDSEALERSITKTRQEARDYYENIILGKAKENASHKRYIESKKIAFAQHGDIANYLKAIIDDEKDVAELIRDYLTINFIKKDSTIATANIDKDKIDEFIEKCWAEAGSKVMMEKKSSTLFGSLRQNFHKNIFKAISIMCSWCVYLDRLVGEGQDESFSKFKSMKDGLIEDIDCAVEYLKKSISEKSDIKYAGSRILISTLGEIKERIEGTYNDRYEKYFYINFLLGDEVMLNDDFMPALDNKHDDIPALKIGNRILAHANAEEIDFKKKLDEIFGGGDNYGSGELILEYLDDVCVSNGPAKSYDVDGSVKYAEKQALTKKSDFEGTIELMENYGQIDNTYENVKEKLLQIADEEYNDACETKNYGFFAKVITEYENQVRSEAKAMEVPLRDELETYKETHNGDVDYDERLPRIEKIEKMIEEQNYTVAEDLLSRLRDNEPESETLPYETDYLEDFINGYDLYMKKVANAKKSVDVLVSKSTTNKAGKGAMKLAANWMNPGCKPNAERTKELLKAMGFPVEKVEAGQKAGRYDNYKVKLERPTNGRKENLTHPIAAFGSGAYEWGFRVAFLHGKYDTDGIIEAIKEIGNAKNTIIMLDYALSLNDRRKLARKIKEIGTSKVFGVIDRTLLCYLMEKYDDMQIGKMVMATMMPFASYQPYVADSATVMPPEIFMGRKEELQKIESPEGVNIVYGGRQLGKSALLRMAQKDIDKNENGDRAILVDIKGKDYKKAVKKIAEELKLREVISKKATITDWDMLAMALKERLMNEDKHIPYLLLLLDEADAFIESCEEVNYAPFDALKDVQSIGNGRFKFVIAGLRNVVKFNREAALSNNSVLTHLKSMTVKPFKSMEARELLEIPLYYLGLRFPADKQFLITMIFARANYFPGLIQMYCTKLVEAMRKSDYAGYNEAESPMYIVNEKHIKKALADEGFRQQVREKFEITLKLDEDNYYYLIALIMAQLYHENRKINGYSAEDILQEGEILEIKKIKSLDTEKLSAFMDELVDLNILRKTSDKEYLFNRYNFLQMMGSKQEVDDKLIECMEE